MNKIAEEEYIKEIKDFLLNRAVKNFCSFFLNIDPKEFKSKIKKADINELNDVISYTITDSIMKFIFEDIELEYYEYGKNSEEERNNRKNDMSVLERSVEYNKIIEDAEDIINKDILDNNKTKEFYIQVRKLYKNNRNSFMMVNVILFNTYLYKVFIKECKKEENNKSKIAKYMRQEATFINDDMMDVFIRKQENHIRDISEYV